jgi:predicted  nucleic acid-binding Zn-ribbon protein
MSISAGEIVKLLKSDKDALRELSAAIASEPELRLAVINAVLADVATKQDLQQIRQELKGEMAQLRQEMKGEMAQLRQEMKEEIAQLREELRGDITATKQDFQQLRRELREEISQLREEIGILRQHVDSEISQLRRDMNTNFRWTVGLIIAVWGTTVIPLLMRLAGVI